MRFHVAPPSFETYRPPPAPPLFRPHVLMSIGHAPAKTTRGFDASAARSETPVPSSTKSVRSHLFPPSVVR